MVKHGEVWLVNMGEAMGSVQGGIRPAIILQNNMGNEHSPTTIVCPLTSRTKKHIPTHLALSPVDCGLERDSMALCEQIMVINQSQIIKKIGELQQHKILEINNKIKLSLNMG